ncbi:HAD-IA family hydrolase [uncultured Serinicoccus sp.]|uniref:HAD-IA family hydrolase n=1 Tax=uncultured Serinicoccus sp. TaxID=735514 RepID=UPI002635E419|nr:HAD-IA family hydrolase [uncultured Serinicoccus sp.]
MRLKDYRALSFDVYGTLIDWEAGIGGVLVPWAAQVGLGLSEEELLREYARHEADVARERPRTLYPQVLAEAFARTGRALGAEVDEGWRQRLGSSVPDWPAFEDSAEALASLAERFSLIILSNVHREGFAGSNRHLGMTPSAVVTAQDVGAYKPADPHFLALDATLRDLGIAREEHLHVAQSLFHDHVPAARRGLDSVWINRRHARPGWGATPEPRGQWSYLAEYPSMAAFAQAVRDGEEI